MALYKYTIEVMKCAKQVMAFLRSMGRFEYSLSVLESACTWLKEFWRVDEELGTRRCRKFIRLVEEGALVGSETQAV